MLILICLYACIIMIRRWGRLLCCSSVVKLCPTLCDPSKPCSMPGFLVLLCLPEFAQIHVHWVGDASYPTILISVTLFSSCSQSFPAWGSFPKSALHIRWPNSWSFSFSISASNEYSVLISFRMNWLDLRAVQGTLKNLLQHTVQKHQFFSAQLSL